MTNLQIRHSNRTILDLKKVAYCRFFFRSKDYQHERDKEPRDPTVNGLDIDPSEYALAHTDYPSETLLERAKRLDVLDKWIPVCIFVLSNGHELEYTGTKARRLYDAYNAGIFGGKK